jgi:hypothetical protein
MSYRCSVCREPSGPGQPRLVHTAYRAAPGQQQIAAEYPVCKVCHGRLRDGLTFAQLLGERGAACTIAAPAVAEAFPALLPAPAAPACRPVRLPPQRRPGAGPNNGGPGPRG